MNIDAAYIKQLNEKVGTLNMERQKQIGAVETAKKSFEAGLAQYNQLYGTQLTADTLQAELDKVSANLATEAAEVERIMKTIEDGSYRVKTTTAVTVTGSDGVLLQDAPKMPSTPLEGHGSIGTPVTSQNAATGVVAPSAGVSAPAVENAAVNPAGNPNQSAPVSAVQNGGVAQPVEQMAEFETFAPAAEVPNQSAPPVMGVPDQSGQSANVAPAFPNFGAPAPVEGNGGQMMFGVAIPNAEMTTPEWANNGTAPAPATGDAINAQFSSMLGGKFGG